MDAQKWFNSKYCVAKYPSDELTDDKIFFISMSFMAKLVSTYQSQLHFPLLTK